MGFRTIIRYYIDPGFDEAKRIPELVAWCRSSRTEEVMLFYNPEELFAGFPPADEREKWFKTALAVKAALDDAGIAMSVNPWTTTVHLSRGRRFGAAEQSYEPMVGETGMVSLVTPCPLSKEWQRDLADFFCDIARRVAPVAIWVEDDWRLHNHEPEMNFGGCFCALHLKRFAELVGRPVSRGEVFEQVLRPGEPHPWRRLWLQLWQDTLAEPAQYLEQRVHAANPAVHLALMSSVPDVHSAEGRDWQRLARAFSPDEPLLLRPHLPPYTEQRPLAVPPTITRQTVAYAPKGTVIYPELENSPRCGRYSKSAAVSAWEMLHSVFYGSTGITINHYDMMGNGIALDWDFDRVLARNHTRLEALAALGMTEDGAEGIDVLSRPDVAKAVRTAKGRSFAELHPSSVVWSETFYWLGISHRIVTAASPERMTAVSGQTLEVMSDDEIRTLLSGRAILDAEATMTAIRRGFGAWLGIRDARWRTLNDAGFAYETIEDGREADYGVDAPRMSAQRCGTRFLHIQPEEAARVRSRIFRFDRSALGPGMMSFANAAGGNVTTIAYELGGGQFFVGFFQNFRRILWQRFVAEMESQAVLGRHMPLHTYRIRTPQGVVAAVLNPTWDSYDSVEFACPGLRPERLRQLDRDGNWHPAALQQLPNGDWHSAAPLPPLDALIVAEQ